MKTLVPLDGSLLAEAAVEVARKQAETHGGEIILLTVGELPEVTAHRQEEHAALRRIVDPVAERLQDLPVSVRTDMGGDAVEAIVRTAEEEGVDQIIMSTHGRSGVSLRTHGSVADGVLRRSTVPVTLVRPGARELEAQRALLDTADCPEFVAAALSLHRGGGGLAAGHLHRLRECLDELPERDQLPVAEAYLAELPEPERRAVAVDFIEHGNPARVEAALSLAPELGPDAIPQLADVAADTTAERRWGAYHAIRKIGGPAAIDPLVEGLQCDDLSVRWIASDGLIEIGHPAIPALLRALATANPTPIFHRAALRVLRRAELSGHEDSLQRLLDSLEHATTVVQAPPLAQELLREIERD
jgi:nucleotide-binding universal stress UspA family protein